MIVQSGRLRGRGGVGSPVVLMMYEVDGGDKKKVWLVVRLHYCKNPGHNQPRVRGV